MLLSTAYFPPIAWFGRALRSDGLVLEAKEHFIKQTWRNRCRIYGGNGPIDLIIPVDHHDRWRTPIDALRVSHETDWKKLHWKSIRSAYGKAPYFDFYADAIEQCYRSDASELLFAFNESCLRCAFKLLKRETNWKHSDSFTPYSETDPRLILSTVDTPHVSDLPHYYQSFADRHGFLSNLSVLDLLFHLGPKSVDYLEALPDTLQQA